MMRTNYLENLPYCFQKKLSLQFLLQKSLFLFFAKIPVPKLVDEVAEGEEGNPLQGHAQQQVDVRLLVRYVNVVVDQA